MDDISYAQAFFGLAAGTALLWGAVFGLAYARRRFGGPARSYLIGFAAAWLGTVAFFVLLTIWEAA